MKRSRFATTHGDSVILIGNFSCSLQGIESVRLATEAEASGAPLADATTTADAQGHAQADALINKDPLAFEYKDEDEAEAEAGGAPLADAHAHGDAQAPEASADSFDDDLSVVKDL